MSGGAKLAAMHPTPKIAAAGHERGEPCLVVETLLSFYGSRVGDYLLWNETCFPMSDSVALVQARLLIEKDEEPGVLRHMALSEGFR